MDIILSVQNFDNALKRKQWTQTKLRREYDKLYSDEKGKSIDSSLKAWRAGINEPGLYRFSRICELLDCDIDYLLGLQESPRKEYAHIAEMTGLSYNAAEQLAEMAARNNDLLPIISKIIENPKLLYDIESATCSTYEDDYLKTANMYVRAETLYNAERTGVFEELMKLIDNIRNDNGLDSL